MIDFSVWIHDWSAEPAVLSSTAIGLAVWSVGRGRLRAGRVDRDSGWRERWWHVPAFAGALAGFLFAACSPIDAFSDELFWVHMIQHLLLFIVVCPLFVAAAPWLPLWYGLPTSVQAGLNTLWRAGTGSFPGRTGNMRWWAMTSLGAFILGTWIWHWPVLYDLALRNEVVHDYLEHNTFIVIGILFWLQIFPSQPFRPALGTLGRGLFLFVAILQNVLLSVILGFAPTALYAPYAALAHRPGGISAHADQQIGAAIMWAIGDLPFVLSLLGLFILWLQSQSAPVTGGGAGRFVSSGESA